jgi:hypothetical protein
MQITIKGVSIWERGQGLHCFDLILAGNYWQETIRALGFEDMRSFREYEYSVFRKDSFLFILTAVHSCQIVNRRDTCSESSSQ